MVAKKTAAKATRAARTKTYAEVESEVDIDSETDPVVKKAAAQKAADVVRAVSGISVETAAQQITDVTLVVGRALADVQQKVIEKANELEQLNEAIRIKEEELQTVFNKETVLLETSQLVADHKRLVADFAAQAQILENNIEQLKIDSEKNRMRDEGEYIYQTKTKRQYADDAFAQTELLKKRQLADQEMALTKSWQERETTLKAREQELADYKAKVDAFPTQLEGEKNKAVAIACSSLKRELEHSHVLVTKELEGSLRLEAAAHATAKNSLLEKDKEIDRLRVALDSAQARVIDVANGAFNSVSGQAALNALQTAAGNNGQQQKTGPGKSS